MTTSKKIIVSLGWLGVILVLGAYILNLLEILSSENWIYLLMNVTGAGLVAWNALTQRAYPAFALEAIWASASLLAIFNLLSA